MRSIEEQLWDYIDGSGTPRERDSIAALIDNNEQYRQTYRELLQLNKEFADIELDEPSMAFTYNVMETIRTEQARQPLKAAINKRIILSITAFFIITILILIVAAISKVNWQGSAPELNVPEINVAKVSSFFTAPLLKGFLFFDVVMGLFLLDGYLRRKNMAKQH